MVTNVANSRITIMASTADDFAPRLAMVGPEDSSASKGWALFDFGSNKTALPNAQFIVRHAGGDGTFVNMIQVFGRDAVTFPKTDVNVGIATDNPQHRIQVTAGGAFSDGTTWENASSRELKENILELRTAEAMEALKNIKPVKFNYKVNPDNETNVGFIAEDVPDLVASKGRKSLNSMNIVAVLTKVVQEQQEMIAKLNAEVKGLKEQMEISAGN
jgi:hypothetical protein